MAVSEGRITALQRIRVAKADSLAEEGASMHPNDTAIVQKTKAAHSVVKLVSFSS